jgi:hypothetical protein
MAVTSGTQVKYDLVGIREELSEMIYMVSPEQTPFISGAGRGEPCKTTQPEWMTETLAAPDSTNAKIEGDEAAFAKPAQPVRVANICQISSKTARVSDTVEHLNLAGRRSEMAKQIAKRAKELKRDQEKILVGTNQGGAAGDEATPRKLASILAWLKTNTNKEGTGTDPVYASGVPLAARGDGATRAFSEPLLQDAIEQQWNEGGTVNTIMLPMKQKKVFSGFAGIATKTVDLGRAQTPAIIMGTADVYISEAGIMRAVPNRFMRDRDVLLLDFDLIAVRYLRPHKVSDLAKTGDAHAKLLVTEYTLEVKQEAGLAAVYDLS